MAEHSSIRERSRRRKERIWHCKKCPSQFPSIRLLKQHRKTSHARNKDDVTKASYSYDDCLDLYSCNTCDAECGTLDEIEKHIKNHDERFKCEQCNKMFSSVYPFAIHLYEHSSDKIFRCPLCSYTTQRRTALLTHVNRMHLQKFPYNCDTCGKGFTDIVYFKEHHNEHSGLKPFVCVVCDRSFQFSRYLLIHQVRNHRVGIEGAYLPNQCNICLRVFAKRGTLEKHIVNKHESKPVREKRHLCDICGKGFATKEKLRVHYRVHTGVKPYTCSYCAKSFTKKDYLVMHERVHSGEKPYSCEYCGKCFNQGSSLRIHVRGHTGERPYVCHICNHGYMSRASLNFHYKSCPGAADVK